MPKYTRRMGEGDCWLKQIQEQMFPRLKEACDSISFINVFSQINFTICYIHRKGKNQRKGNNNTLTSNQYFLRS